MLYFAGFAVPIMNFTEGSRQVDEVPAVLNNWSIRCYGRTCKAAHVLEVSYFENQELQIQLKFQIKTKRLE